MYFASRAALFQDKKGVEVVTSYENSEQEQETTSSSTVSVIGNVGQSKMFKFKVTNKGDTPVKFETCIHFLLHDTRSVVLSDSGQVTSCKRTQVIPKNCE